MPGIQNEILKVETYPGGFRQFRLKDAVVSFSRSGEWQCNCDTVLWECHTCGAVRSEAPSVVGAGCQCGSGMARIVKNTPNPRWKPGIGSGDPPCSHIEKAYLYFLDAEHKAWKMKKAVAEKVVEPLPDNYTDIYGEPHTLPSGGTIEVDYTSSYQQLVEALKIPSEYLVRHGKPPKEPNEVKPGFVMQPKRKIILEE